MRYLSKNTVYYFVRLLRFLLWLHYPTVFWDVKLCGVADTYRCLEETRYLHHEGEWIMCLYRWWR